MKLKNKKLKHVEFQGANQFLNIAYREKWSRIFKSIKLSFFIKRKNVKI